MTVRLLAVALVLGLVRRLHVALLYRCDAALPQASGQPILRLTAGRPLPIALTAEVPENELLRGMREISQLMHIAEHMFDFPPDIFGDVSPGMAMLGGDQDVNSFLAPVSLRRFARPFLLRRAQPREVVISSSTPLSPPAARCLARAAASCASSNADTPGIAACLQLALQRDADHCGLRGETERRVVFTACADDIHRFCPKVQPGGNRVHKCLAEHAKALSAKCHAYFADGHDRAIHTGADTHHHEEAEKGPGDAQPSPSEGASTGGQGASTGSAGKDEKDEQDQAASHPIELEAAEEASKPDAAAQVASPAPAAPAVQAAPAPATTAQTPQPATPAAPAPASAAAQSPQPRASGAAALLKSKALVLMAAGALAALAVLAAIGVTLYHIRASRRSEQTDAYRLMMV